MSEIFPHMNNIFIIWKTRMKDMTKVFNWVHKLKMATIKEKADWKGFSSTGEPNKLSLVCIEYQIVRSGKGWASVKH